MTSADAISVLARELWFKFYGAEEPTGGVMWKACNDYAELMLDTLLASGVVVLTSDLEQVGWRTEFVDDQKNRRLLEHLAECHYCSHLNCTKEATR